jgi:hypothetical protein
MMHLPHCPLTSRPTLITTGHEGRKCASMQHRLSRMPRGRSSFRSQTSMTGSHLPRRWLASLTAGEVEDPA